MSGTPGSRTSTVDVAPTGAPVVQVVVDQYMTHLRLRSAVMSRQPRIDDQHIEGFGRDGREYLDLFESLHRHDPVVPQPIEHFFDVQPLQVLFIGNQDGQCFVWHGKPLGRQRSSVSAAHSPDIFRRLNQESSPFA